MLKLRIGEDKTNQAGIHILNDDCLRCIFKYLPIVDRIRIERVCKHWRQTSRNSWIDFHSLNFKTDDWGICIPSDSFDTKFTLRIIENVLRRCGKYLKSVDFEHYRSNCDSGEVSLVARYCSQLQHLHLYPRRVKPQSLIALAKHCHKITSLSMGFGSKTRSKSDFELGSLFANNPELRHIYLMSSDRLTWECLRELHPQNIETIALIYCRFMLQGHLDIIKRFPKLKGLIIQSPQSLDDERIKSISFCTTLEFLRLSISRHAYSPPSDVLHQLTKLINLKELNLSNNSLVDDNFLTCISTGFKHLHYLNIAECKKVTDVGLVSLAFTNLKYLNVGGLDKVTDKVFETFKAFNLSYLLCYNCSNICDEGLMKLIECSEQLEHLDVNKCSKLTNKLIRTANYATMQRRNLLFLNLYIKDTQIVMNKDLIIRPFLNVVEDIFYEEKLVTPISEFGRIHPRYHGRFH